MELFTFIIKYVIAIRVNNKINLPPHLAKYTDEERITQNAERYPEMQRELTSGEKLGVEVVKRRLLKLPLSHSTKADFQKIEQSGIHTFTTISQDPNNGHSTLALDESLGLGEYVFMHLGGIQKKSYGRKHVLVDPAAVFESPNTIVTPFDINDTAFRYVDAPIESLDDKGKEIVEAYLDSMVTGKAWLDIIARRALQKMLRNDKIPLIHSLKSTAEFGEIKHYGNITPDILIGFVDDEEGEHHHWREMLALGFAPSPVANALDMEYRGLPSPSSYDKLPEDIGVDRAIPHAAWAEVLAIARE